jgi:hypothetical protein
MRILKFIISVTSVLSSVFAHFSTEHRTVSTKQPALKRHSSQKCIAMPLCFSHTYLMTVHVTVLELSAATI